MLDLNAYFKDEYQFILKEVTYHCVEREDDAELPQIQTSDSASAKVVDGQLEVEFSREVKFQPASVFDLKVTFGIIMHFQDEVDPSAVEVDWCEALTANENPYFSNIISRASNIIAFLTSSYGLQPLITPPVFLNEE